ncbi:hypothetical protein LX36DRAFT_145254 [Colletotrichum falcatum]|nr:hypothetical protein LX36DRAFT_145254 [Colletotrichum falcatum]
MCAWGNMIVALGLPAHDRSLLATGGVPEHVRDGICRSRSGGPPTPANYEILTFRWTVVYCLGRHITEPDSNGFRPHLRCISQEDPSLKGHVRNCTLHTLP